MINATVTYSRIRFAWRALPAKRMQALKIKSKANTRISSRLTNQKTVGKQLTFDCNQLREPKFQSARELQLL